MLTRRVPVSFAGEGAGEAKLSWGQKDIWLAMVRQNSWLPMGGWTRLPAGSTVADGIAELEYVMSRFQPMRTKLRFDGEGEPWQVVFAQGETCLDVIEGHGDLDELAESVRLWYHKTPFDFENDWPVRMAVIEHEGKATHLIAIMCHLVSDGLGALVMLADCATRTREPVDGTQPLAQALWQATAAGQRQNAAAQKHWEKTLLSVPSLSFPPSSQRPQPRHWRGDFSSPALLQAVHALTVAAQVDSSQVLLATFASALNRVSGVNPVAIRPMVSNRFRPGLSNVVALVAQYGLCALDVAGLTFREVLSQVGKVTMTAYKHAYYDPADLQKSVASILAEREPAFFNDRRMETRQGFPGPVPSAGDILDAAGQYRLDWTIKQDDPFEPLILHVDDAPGAMNIVVFMDTHFIAPEVAEELLRAMEEVAVQASQTHALVTAGRQA